MSFNFTQEYLKNKPIFYHFLDQYITENSGYNSNSVIDFIIHEMKDYLPILDTPINFCNLIWTESKYILTIENNYSQNIIHDFELPDMPIDLSHIFKNKFSIINVNTDDHSTSIIVYFKDGLYYVMLINSGDGLDNHKSIVLNDSTKLTGPQTGGSKSRGIFSVNLDNETLYKPYLTITLREDEIDKIKGILFISFFYNNINKISVVEVYKIIKKYIILISESFDINIMNNDNIISYKNLEDLYHKGANLKFMDTYYNIIAKLFKTLKPQDNLKKDYSTIKHIELPVRTCFHFYDNDIYIFPQQSGSCTWFSKYWAICIYYLIYDEFDIYYKFIQNVFNKFMVKINTIFTSDNFKLEFENISNKLTLNKHNINSMYILAQKLVNLDILDNNILDNNILINNHLIGTKISVSNDKLLLSNISKFSIDNINLDKNLYDFLDNLFLYCYKDPYDAERGYANIYLHTNMNIFNKYICDYIEKNEFHPEYNLDAIFNNNIYDYNNIINGDYNIITIIKDNYTKLNTLNHDYQMDFMDTIKDEDINQYNFTDKNNNIFNILDIFNIFNISDIIYKFDSENIAFQNLIYLFSEINNISADHIYEKQIKYYYIIKYYLNINDDNKLIKYIKYFDKLYILIRFLYIIHKIEIVINKKIDDDTINNIVKPKLNESQKIILDRYIHLYNENMLTIINNIFNTLSNYFFNNIVYSNYKKLLLKSDILKNIIFERSYIKPLQQVINLVKVQTFYYYGYKLSNFSNPSSIILDNGEYYQDIKININDLKSEKNLLLNNPSYIFNNYLNKLDIINPSLFIKLNINEIYEN